MLDDRTKISPERRRGPLGTFRTMMGDGLDRSSTIGKISLAYRYAVLVLGLALCLPWVIWLIERYPTSRYEQDGVRGLEAMAAPLIAAAIELRLHVVRRAFARIRAWADSFGTVRRR